MNNNHDVAARNFPPFQAKDVIGIYRPADERIWFGGGDQSHWGLVDVDGFTDGFNGSNTVFIGSFAVDNPTHICRESAIPVTQDEIYGQRDDGPFFVHDPINDRGIYYPSSTFGGSLDQAHATRAPRTPVTYLSSTSARIPASLSEARVGTKIRFNIAHPVGGAVAMRGRVTAVADAGSGFVDVTVAWFDQSCTFQNPQSVALASDGNGHWTQTGAWDDAYSFTSFNETTGRFYRALHALNYVTGEVSRLLFQMPTATAPLVAGHGQFIHPAATGRNPELWAVGSADSPVLRKYDLTTLVVTDYSPSWGVDVREFTRINQGCTDGAGRIFAYAPLSNRIIIIDVRAATPAVSARTIAYPTALYNVGSDNNFFHSCYSMVWNEDLGLIEMYVMHGGGSIGVGNSHLFLLDPATDPVVAHYVGPRDGDGLQIWGCAYTRVAGSGGSPGRTFIFGGNGVGAGTPDRMRVFIGGNLRPEELGVAEHRRLIAYWKNEATTNAGVAVTADYVPYRDWGGFVVAPNGRAYYFGGGHGEYHGTCVDQCDLNAISGRTMPWVQNIGPTRSGNTQFPPSGDLDDYMRNHCPSEVDPIDGQPNSGYGSAGSNWMWFNQATAGSWQHDAIHVYSAAFSRPEDNAYWIMANVPRNGTMPANRRDHNVGLRSWNPTTGKWTAHLTGIPFDGNQGSPGDWNAEHGYYLYYYVPSSRNAVQFFQWSPVGGAQAGPMLGGMNSDTVPNVAFNGCCLWLSGHRFLLIAASLNRQPKMFLYSHSLSTPALQDVTPTMWTTMQGATPENGYFCVDRDRGRVWMLEGLGNNNQPRLYYAPIGDPVNFRRLKFVDEEQFRVPTVAVSAAGYRGIQYHGGYLWMPIRGAQGYPGGKAFKARFWRIPVL